MNNSLVQNIIDMAIWKAEKMQGPSAPQERKLMSAWKYLFDLRENACGQEELACAEHYMYARWQVCEHGYLMYELMKIYVYGYTTAKIMYFLAGLGYVARKGLYEKVLNTKCPPTKPSYWQAQWGLQGCEDGWDDR